MSAEPVQLQIFDKQSIYFVDKNGQAKWLGVSENGFLFWTCRPEKALSSSDKGIMAFFKKIAEDRLRPFSILGFPAVYTEEIPDLNDNPYHTGPSYEKANPAADSFVKQ